MADKAFDVLHFNNVIKYRPGKLEKPSLRA
jgi:hypothetical protein